MVAVDLLSSKITREKALDLILNPSKYKKESVDYSSNEKTSKSWDNYFSNPAKHTKTILAYGLGIGLERQGKMLTAYFSGKNNIEAHVLLSKNTSPVSSIDVQNKITGEKLTVNMDHYVSNNDKFLGAKQVDSDYFDEKINEYHQNRPMIEQLRDVGFVASERVLVNDFRDYNQQFTGVDLPDAQGSSVIIGGKELELSKAEIILANDGLPYLCYAIQKDNGYAGGCLIQDARSGRWASGLTDDMKNVPMCGWYEDLGSTIDRLGIKLDRANSPGENKPRQEIPTPSSPEVLFRI